MTEQPGYPSQYPPRGYPASGAAPQDGWFDGAQGDPYGAPAAPDPYAPRNGAYSAGQQQPGGTYGAPAQDQYSPQSPPQGAQYGAGAYGAPSSGAGTYGAPSSGAGPYGAPSSGGAYGAPSSGGAYGSYGGPAQDQHAPAAPSYGGQGGDQYGAPGQYGGQGGGQYGAPGQYGGQYGSTGQDQYAAPAPSYGAPPEAPRYGAADSGGFGAPTSGASGGFGAPPQEPWQQSAMPGASGQPGRGSLNVMAVISLICGLIGFALFGLIFGFVGLSQIKKRGQRGRGLAIGGIVLSVLWFLAVVGAVAWAVMASSADRNDAGEITDPGSVSSFDLKPGDCLNGLTESNNITSVPAVPCAQPHDGEVFATFELGAGSWPGDAAVAKQAEEGCVQRLGEYSAKAPKDEKLEIFFLHPTSASWAQGDHEVTCVAMDSAKRTGSIKD